MIQNNGESLAYLGDCFYEFQIRKYLLSLGFTSVNVLHKTAINYTSGVAQASIMDYLLDNELLSEKEIGVYKRGRNSSHTSNGRSIDRSSYQKSTGFEALLGFLYLSGLEERALELIEIGKEVIRRKLDGKLE